MFDQKMYVTPAEKHSLVKTISFCIYLMDSERSNINVLLKKELPRLDQIFSTVQYVPLFGDMQTYPFDSVIKKSKNFDPSNWPKSMAARSNQDFHPQVPMSINHYHYYGSTKNKHWGFESTCNLTNYRLPSFSVGLRIFAKRTGVSFLNWRSSKIRWISRQLRRT